MLFKEVTVFAYLPNVVGGGIAGIEDRTPFQYDTFADWKGGGVGRGDLRGCNNNV